MNASRLAIVLVACALMGTAGVQAQPWWDFISGNLIVGQPHTSVMVGVGTQMPQDRVHVHTGIPSSILPSAVRLSQGLECELTGQVLLHPGTGVMADIPIGSRGDVILRSDGMTGCGNNVMLWANTDEAAEGFGRIRIVTGDGDASSNNIGVSSKMQLYGQRISAGADQHTVLSVQTPAMLGDQTTLNGSANAVIRLAQTDPHTGILPTANDAHAWSIGADFDLDMNGLASTFRITAGDNPTLANSALTLTQDGNVGIGTDTPQDALQISDEFVFNIDGTTNYLGYNWSNGVRLRNGTVSRMVFSDDNGVGRLGWELAPQDNAGTAVAWADINQRMWLTTTGLGIGLENPTNTLDVRGQAVIGTGYSGSATAPQNGVLIEGHVGIGTTDPQEALQIGDKFTFHNGAWKYIGYNWGAGKYMSDGRASRIAFADNGNILFSSVAAGTAGNPISSANMESMVIADDGNGGINVGIGVGDPQQKLVVDGMICAKEIRVQLNGSPCWWDRVFDAEYELMPLDELEKSVRANRHLPDIPSESEVIANGIELGALQAKFLKKIEELTLYVIELNKENNNLRERITALEEE